MTQNYQDAIDELLNKAARYDDCVAAMREALRQLEAACSHHRCIHPKLMKASGDLRAARTCVVDAISDLLAALPDDAAEKETE